MTAFRLPSATAVQAMHARLIARDGGAPGLRDAGALDAALARPAQLAAYGGEGDEVALAVAVAFSIVRLRHPFVDGNKRVALALLLVALGLNGWELDAPEGETAAILLDVAAGGREEAAFAAWVRARAVPAGD